MKTYRIKAINPDTGKENIFPLIFKNKEEAERELKTFKACITEDIAKFELVEE